MSEERHASPMSAPVDGDAGASAFAPVMTEPSVTASTPVARDSALSPVTAPPSVPPREPTVARRRLSLRIPDDEILRPGQPADERAASNERPPFTRRSPMPPSDMSSQGMPMGTLTPMRIISINAESAPPREWPASPPEPTLTSVDVEIPSAPDLPPLSDSLVVTPRMPASLEADEVEVRFDDDAMVSAPRVLAAPGTVDDRERRSDPPPEVAAEDVFAIESTDLRPTGSPGVPMQPGALSQPPVPRPIKRGELAPNRPPLVIVPPHVGSIPPQSTDGTGTRRKGRLWWEELFNDDYVRATEKVTDEYIAREVRFIEESLGVEDGGALLDLACGAGRHAVELARQGYEVVGFDLSLPMLARAGEEAQDRHAKLNFVQGDMREMAFDEQFDGVYCWNTSFGYFEEDKNAQVIDRVHRALKGGGLFLLDVINRDFLVRQSPSLAWFEGDGCVCMDEMSIDFITSRMKVKRTMMLDDGRSREIEYSIRVYSLYELGRVLHEHGFKVREVSGGLAAPGVFFGGESPRVIVLAEKR